jgi:hypothetical protein
MEPFPAPNSESVDDDLFDARRHASLLARAQVDGNGFSAPAGTNIDGASGNSQRAKTSLPETIANDASFPDIYEAFTSRGCTELVVTAGDKPLGYITCYGFLSMIDPIHAESFAHTDKSVDELAFLVVPSMALEQAAQHASAE